MARFTSYDEGIFSWADLMAKDQAAARKFYGDLFGWTADDNPTDQGGAYTLFSKDGEQVAGLGEMSPEMKASGMPAVWNSYVTVVDAEAATKRAESLGGKIQMPTMKVMDAGWMAIIADPGGAMISVWQPNQHIGATMVNEVGGFCWNERLTRDVAQAKEFYTGLFGWTYQDGAEGYQMIQHAGRMNGGILPYRDEMGPVPDHWSVYFSVADCDATVEALKAAGGQLLMGPVDIEPGRFATVVDPQGAVLQVMKLNPPG
jgi:hypothetical protein